MSKSTQSKLIKKFSQRSTIRSHRRNDATLSFSVAGETQIETCLMAISYTA